MNMAALNIAFWNVQNLFEPGLVPRGPSSPAEYDAKLTNVARAINAFFSSKGPDLLGLAEIGTRKSLDLLRAKLREKYTLIWEEPPLPEETGVALLACEGLFRQCDKLVVQTPSFFSRPRCMIVECALSGAPREPFLVALNHWKSRMQYDTDTITDSADRQESARWLGDYLAQQAKATAAIVMGDFNAEPFESPFNEVSLRGVRHFSTALWGRATPAYLYNTAWRFLAEPSYYEDWSMAGYKEERPKTTHDCSPPVVYDQLLVSGRALRGGALRLREKSVSYYCDANTSHFNSRGVLRPHRWAYDADTGASGTSDHFPLLATFDLT